LAALPATSTQETTTQETTAKSTTSSETGGNVVQSVTSTATTSESPNLTFQN
jgi:hypothetical protein